MNRKVNCDSHINIPYYGTFESEPLCFNCATDEDLNQDENIYPICKKCSEDGKNHTIETMLG